MQHPEFELAIIFLVFCLFITYRANIWRKKGVKNKYYRGKNGTIVKDIKYKKMRTVLYFLSIILTVVSFWGVAYYYVTFDRFTLANMKIVKKGNVSAIARSTPTPQKTKITFVE